MRGPNRFYQQGLRRSKPLLLLGALALWGACKKPEASSPPPDVVTASRGPFGWVEGELTARGKLPSLHPHRVDGALVKQCGAEAPDLSLVVNESGALAFAVVSLDDASPSPLSASFKPALVDQQACVYRPPVVATRAGQSILVRNSDPLLHNVRAMHERSPIFNVMMPIENLTIDKKLPPVAGLVELRCDVHPWMHAWVVTFSHDLYAVTGADGRFRIDGVPVGHHQLKLWHPRLGDRHVELEVKADAGTLVPFGWEVSDNPAP